MYLCISQWLFYPFRPHSHTKLKPPFSPFSKNLTSPLNYIIKTNHLKSIFMSCTNLFHPFQDSSATIYIFNKYFPFQACLTDSGGQLWRWRILQEGVCRGQPAEQNLQTPKGRDECWLNINLMTLGNYQRIYKEFISDKGPGPSHFKWSRSRRMVHVINFLRTSYPH